MEKLKPEKVKKYQCPKCGELLIKVYPWAAVNVKLDLNQSCKRCLNKKIDLINKNK